MLMNRSTTGQRRRLLLIGGGQFLVDTIQLANKYFEVSVITNARHQATTVNLRNDTCVQRLALADLDVAILETEQFAIPQVWSGSAYFDATLSISSHWIFTEKDINAVGPNFFNLHNSDLPNFRGGGGLTWSILARAKEGGVTIHRVDLGIDTGEVVMQRRYSFPKEPDLKELIALQRAEANTLLSEFVSKLDLDVDFIEKQLSEADVSDVGSYWPRLSTKENAWIDWTWPVDSILDFIRAFGPPFAGAATHFRGEEVRFRQARLHDADSYYHPFQWGIIFGSSNGEFLVAANGGSLSFSQLFVEGVQLAPGGSWLGERLFTPHECLSSSYSTRFRLH